MKGLLVISIFVCYAVATAAVDSRLKGIKREPRIYPLSYERPGQPPQGHPLRSGGGGQRWPGQMSPPAHYVRPWDFRPGPGQLRPGPSQQIPQPQPGPSNVRPPSPGQGQGFSQVVRPPSWIPPQWRRYYSQN